MDRRKFLGIATGAATAGVLGGPSWGTAGRAARVVETMTGKLSGMQAEGVMAYLGIPYGAPTQRFMPPQSAKPWAGIRSATSFGPRAPQIDASMGDNPLGKLMNQLWRFSHDPMSEDCLHLNVWTPAADGKKRPVMFWCHGGGFAVGSGQEPDYIGDRLAKKHDVVVVTVNHRLNVLGYCYLASIGGLEFAASGNVGMLDLVQALGWVRDNIAGFGGDPANVTIFGQSGGGSKVSVLLGMPAAKGLFHKAIIMSGPGVRVMERAKAEQNTAALLAKLQLAPGNFDRLRTMPVEQLVAIGGMVGMMPGSLNFAPMLDGVSVPAHPFDPQATAVSATIPLIIGHTRDEMSTMMVGDIVANQMTEAEFTARVKMIAGPDHAEEVISLYRSTYPKATLPQLAADIATDSWIGFGSTKIADLKAAQGKAPVYSYLVTWEVPALNGALRATHGEDTGLAFDNVAIGRHGLYGTGPGPQQIADIITGSWTSFARTGSPIHAGIPGWPRYSIQNRETFIIDTPPRVTNDPQRTIRELWTRIGGKLP